MPAGVAPVGSEARRAGQLGQVAAVDGECADGAGLALVHVQDATVGAEARVTAPMPPLALTVVLPSRLSAPPEAIE